jgi:hypothetical protein
MKDIILMIDSESFISGNTEYEINNYFLILFLNKYCLDLMLLMII